MTLAETIQAHVQVLPPTLQRETLDFIEFLEQRYSLAPAIGTVPDDTEAFLKAVVGTLGYDFPDDITDEDLGKDSPRESLD